MKRSGVVIATVLLCGCPQKSMDDVVQSFGKSYNVAFARLGTLGLADSQTRITRMNEAGKPFQAELESLKTRQHAVNDLIVKAVELKKKAVDDKTPAVVEDATRLLHEASQAGDQLHADIIRFNEKLTSAGAPILPPEPPRDPNARD